MSLEGQVHIAEWSSSVARRAHNPEVAGSNPVSATISSAHNGFDVMNTRFFMLLLESGHFACSPSLCGDIFHGHALPCFGDIMTCQRRCRDVDVPHKAVVNCDALCSTFSDALRFVHLDMVNKLPQQRCGQLVHLHKLSDGSDKLVLNTAR